ncbi:hypothetical protein [Micromonospora sp. KC606]|uniref:hypothetical protein n=1 Tax=Micromonospora sp. KC606 TaxID=2530379 RepID=UPI0014044885|nr:hypothetical protein [Micromonospora sp. KC606]
MPPSLVGELTGRRAGDLIIAGPRTCGEQLRCRHPDYDRLRLRRMSSHRCSSGRVAVVIQAHR